MNSSAYCKKRPEIQGLQTPGGSICVLLNMKKQIKVRVALKLLSPWMKPYRKNLEICSALMKKAFLPATECAQERRRRTAASDILKKGMVQDRNAAKTPLKTKIPD